MNIDFRKCDRRNFPIHAPDLGGLGFLLPGSGVEDGAMIGGRFATSGSTGGSGASPERALEAINKSLARSAKAFPSPSFPASAGLVPRSRTRVRRNGPGDPRESILRPPGRSRIENHFLTWFPSHRKDHNSAPIGTWDGVRNVLIRTPRPQTVIEGKRLNQSPAGTSGLVSSQTAKELRARASMLRSAIRWSRCPKSALGMSLRWTFGIKSRRRSLR